MAATPPRTSPKPRSRRVPTHRRPLQVATFVLEQYLVQRFVPATDEDYADILHMLELAEARGFLSIT